MNCPICPEVTLSLSERQGIEIDFCPKCRGVWLDRGELDKLIEKSIGKNSSPSEGHYEYKKKKSFLSDIFD